MAALQNSSPDPVFARRGVADSSPIRRLVFVVSTLHAGGAERVVSLLADRLAERGDDVTIVTYTQPDTDYFRVDARVRRIGIDSAAAISRMERVGANVRRVVTLRRRLAALRPHAVISFMDAVNVVTLIASVRAGWPVIASERTDPRRWPIGRVWRLLRRLTYPQAAWLVAQTPSVAVWLRSVARGTPASVVPNPVAPAPRVSATREAVVLAVGRLQPEKGVDLLVDAFARIAPRHPDWQLRIIGDGPERARLRAQAERAGLHRRVRFEGRADPGPAYATAAVYVLPSRLEGFPNTLLEAMAHGMAVIAADCDSGPRDIVTPDVDGILVPPEDPAAIAGELDRLLNDAELRERLGKAARAVTERYSVDAIADAWLNIVDAVSSPERRPSRLLAWAAVRRPTKKEKV